MQSYNSISATAPIMVLTQNSECTRVLKDLLLDAGFVSDVLDFSNGSGAASFLGQYTSGEHPLLPLLAFIDLQVPQLTGISFLWWLRSEHIFDSLPVITLGCSKQEKDIAPERRLGSDFYLYKYPSVSMLRRVCGNAIARRGRFSNNVKDSTRAKIDNIQFIKTTRTAAG